MTLYPGLVMIAEERLSGAGGTKKKVKVGVIGKEVNRRYFIVSGEYYCLN